MNIQPSNSSVLEPDSRSKAIEAIKSNNFEQFKENVDKICNINFDNGFLVRFCVAHRRPKMLAYISNRCDIFVNQIMFPVYFTPNLVSEINNHIRLFKLERLENA